MLRDNSFFEVCACVLDIAIIVNVCAYAQRRMCNMFGSVHLLMSDWGPDT